MPSPAAILPRLLFAGLLLPAAGGAAPKPADLDFFEQKIRPVLVSECYDCHGAKKQKGGLRLDSRAGLLKGGETGPGLIPGDAKKSLLIQSITHEHEDLQMPKKAAKLEDAVIRDFVDWVNRGAPDPRDHEPAEDAPTPWPSLLAVRKQWWSFQQVRAAEPPVVPGAEHPVDRFLTAKMREKGLTPAPRADKPTLIRRATFTLTGLPPTPAEVTTFLADESPEAFAKVVDRLLASPRYGEHWARHWMDLVRFAESHGSEGDPEIPLAWRYRDYLIRAFNADIPYDQFVREQIAGDLLPEPRINRAEGLNESALGPAHFRMVEHGFMPVDTADEQVRNVDNQIDVLSKAFLGLTVSCARCHDHKFDAISQQDFYAFFGILASTKPAQVTVDSPERLGLHREELIGLKDRIRDALADAWLAEAKQLPTNLSRAAELSTRRTKLQERVTELEQRIAGLEFSSRLHCAPSAGPLPAHWWTFETNGDDLRGKLDARLEGGARIERGRLILDGVSAFASTDALAAPLRAKTLEAWVALPSLDQGGGGVLTVETTGGAIFDSLVFAEKQSRRWMAGSNNGRRTQNFDGPAEDAAPGALTHLALVYGTDHRITLYRNGVPYGASYVPTGMESELREFKAGESRVLLGRRHTGGGRAFLRAEIEEARLYDRALSPAEVTASFQAGVFHGKPADLTRQPTAVEQENLRQLRSTLTTARRELEELDRHGGAVVRALTGAPADPRHPLHAWSRLSRSTDLTKTWSELRGLARAETMPKPRWDLAHGDDAQWFRHGNGFTENNARGGDFAVEPQGPATLKALLPAGAYGNLLSGKHSAVLTSPRFKIETDFISIRVLGRNTHARLIVDNYPIGADNRFPQADLNSDQPVWIRFDTAYRKGSHAYLEFATTDDLTRAPAAPKGTKAVAGPHPGWFGVVAVVCHDQKDLALPAAPSGLKLIADGDAPADATEIAERTADALNGAIRAWRKGKANDAQVALLDTAVRHGLLPADTASTAALLTEYRRVESQVPVPRRAPGLLEGRGFDQPLFVRGDHNKPADAVPRRYLEAFGSRPFGTALSGRLELAERIANPANPLSTRVIANRLWQHVFDRGLVGTVDNFGRLGDKPTHPELLDYLAHRFTEHGWSIKETLRFLMLSDAYQRSCAPSDLARERDPANDLLSHMRVRRIEAESIRDSLLTLAGQLDGTLYGPGDSVSAAPPAQRRRSVYLTIRRNALSPLLSTFDAPKPFTTQGRRDSTNVPAQSLTFLNDPFVVHVARQWAARAEKTAADERGRITVLFTEAFARPPNETELAAARRYLAESTKENGATAAWADLAQSLLNLKEFIYVR